MEIGLKKTFLVLSLGFSMCDVIMGACFHFFGPVYLALGTNPTGLFFDWTVIL